MADPAPGNFDGLLPDAPDQQDSLASEISAPDVSAHDDDLTVLPQSEIEETKAPDAEPAGDREANAASKMAPFDGLPPALTTAAEGAKRARATTADSAATPVSPPAPREPSPSTESPNVAKPLTTDLSTRVTDKPQQNPPGPTVPPSTKAQDQLSEVLRGHQGAAPLNAAAMIAAALTGGLRRPEPLATAAAVTAPKDARTIAPSLLDRLAVKSILDNLRRPQAQAPAGQAAPATGVSASAAPPRDNGAPKSAFPASGLRDKLGIFTAERMQARRDAEVFRGAMQSGTAVLASLEALERRETAGILNKIRDAAKANGGIENVLSEMRAGGAFEDLRKEFNVALSHDEGFATAYEKAASVLSGYTDMRAGMISAPRPRADINARLETLDQEIGAAAKTLPGLKDGKTALDEALEGGKEVIEKVFAAVHQTLTPDAGVRGPSPSPRFGP